MSNWNDYQREEAPRIEAGDYRVEIVEAEESISKSSGNPMIVVTVKPNGGNIKIKHFIVKNNYFNRNMTEFFDSFNIEEGDFNFLTWVGAVGAAKLKEDEQGYLKVAYFIKKEKAQSLPEWIGDKPERQTVEQGLGYDEVIDDDLPWGNSR
jgi:hypothetical protein